MANFGNLISSANLGGGTDFTANALNNIGNTARDIIGGEVSKHATGPIKDALGKAGLGALGDFFDGFLADKEGVPSQYMGATDLRKPSEELFSDDRYTQYKYNLGTDSNTINDKHPQMKFMFAAEFIFNSNDYYRQNLMNLFPPALTLALKNCTFPRGDLETEEVNSYNRNRVIVKKLRYQPISATFGETVAGHVDGNTNASMLEIWSKILAYYNNDPTIVDSPDTAQTRAYGHRSGNDTKNLLKYIDLYFIWANSTKRIRLVNPFITSFSYDGLDYASDEQMNANLDIKYEYVEMTRVNGSFMEFMQTKAGEVTGYGAPYDLVEAQNPRNTSLIANTVDIDNQRKVQLDNAYARAALLVAEQKAISAARGLINSDNIIEQELGKEAVRLSLNAGQTLLSTIGGGAGIQTAVTNVGKATNSFISGLF